MLINAAKLLNFQLQSGLPMALKVHCFAQKKLRCTAELSYSIFNFY